jgi:hypothetical protein
MTISDAARHLRLSRQRIIELIDLGTIGWRDEAGQRHIDLNKVVAWEQAATRKKFRGRRCSSSRA